MRQWKCNICNWIDDDENLLNEHILDDHGDEESGNYEEVEPGQEGK